MTKKKASIIFILLFIIVAAALGALFLLSPSPEGGIDGDGIDFGSGQDVGANGSGTPTPTVVTDPSTGTIPKSDPTRLQKITQGPVAGFVSFKTTDNQMRIRYIERQTGHVFETLVGASEVTKISSTPIPRLQEAIWSSDGSHLLVRYLNDEREIETYLAKLVPISTTSILNNQGVQFYEMRLIGTFLERGVRAAAFALVKGEYAYLLDNPDRLSLIIGNTETGKKNEVWNSPLREWLLSWPRSKTITLLTAPSAASEGYLYFLSRDTLKFEKVLGGAGSFTALPHPTLDYILISEGSGGEVKLKIASVKNRTPIETGIKTFPEKCVWSLKSKSTDVYCGVPQGSITGTYPDLWYQGVASFSDSLWRISLASSSSDQIFTPEVFDAGTIDIISPHLTALDEYFLFINKKDGSLWSYRLK